MHLSALLHALECLFEDPYKDLVGTAVGESRTSLECKWVKPRKCKVPAPCADDLDYIKHENGKKRRRNATKSDFDPRPPARRDSSTTEAGKEILCNGLKRSGTCAELML